MIDTIAGNIWDTMAQAIVVPVNCVGVTGAGLARDWNLRYPDAAATYRTLCTQGEMTPGCVRRVYPSEPSHPSFLVFATKNHWKHKSKLEWIENGLTELREHLLQGRILSLAIPKVGCGYGGLDWQTQVEPLVRLWAHQLPPSRKVFVYV